MNQPHIHLGPRWLTFSFVKSNNLGSRCGEIYIWSPKLGIINFYSVLTGPIYKKLSPTSTCDIPFKEISLLVHATQSMIPTHPFPSPCKIYTNFWTLQQVQSLFRQSKPLSLLPLKSWCHISDESVPIWPKSNLFNFNVT